MNVLLNPAFPKREGTNVHGDKDANGKLFHDEFMRVIIPSGLAGSPTCSPNRTRAIFP